MPAGIPRRRNEGRTWLVIFLIGLAGCVVAFGANLFLAEVHPGNWWGLSYGIVATVLMAGTILYGLRRRTMSVSSKLRLGRSRAWVYFHLYGGTLFAVLMLMHMGFRWPHGMVGSWLFWLSVITVVSGFAGLFLQKWVPRALSSGLSVEVLYDRIPTLVEALQEKAEMLVKNADPAVRDFHAARIVPVLQRPRRRWIYLFDVSGGVQRHLREFNYLAGFLPREDRQRLEQLEDIFKTKLEMDAHWTLQPLLRVWLYSHVPVSLFLLGFLVLHLFTVWYW